MLEAMLRAGEDRTVAVLTCMHPAKARQLIGRLTGAPHWLADLPTATAAIRRAHDDARTTLGDESGAIVRLEPPGFRLNCTNGTVYWSPAAGAVPVHEPFLAYYEATGGPDGPLGFPLHPARGNSQQFADSRVVVTSGHGTFTTTLDLYRKKFLGAPLAETAEVGTGWRQRFEHGDVDTDPLGSTFVVADDIREALRATAWTDQLALTSRVSIRSSISGTRGSWQQFGSSNVLITVYVTGNGRTAILGHATQAAYRRNGGPEGWLGFPLTNRFFRPLPNRFEGGVIIGRLAVPNAVYQASQAAGLGDPVSEAEPLGTGEDKAQFFQRGLVTVRAGKVQAWTSNS
ncbi:hypothetical protein AB0J72_54065 [Dactylosporangium sp. NPDC049742]|uniref:LGFP repeat-containing protein n=1 Tax=Dactylosporangium sp. NPDC049742 TaxID=3154737 RepID=UPI0034350807